MKAVLKMDMPERCMDCPLRAAAALLRLLPPKEGQRMRYIVIAYEVENQETTAERAERHMRQRQQEKYERQQHIYFLKQRLYGVALIALTVIATRLLDGDAAIALVLIPMAIVLIFSKEMYITNEFYWKEQERK